MSQGRPRLCQECGIKPKALRGKPHCFDCMPGGPFTPPPCARCGSVGDHFSGGLCNRCHNYGAQRVDSCLDCHAWGATRTHTWLCTPCVNWRTKYPVGSCRTCHRSLAVGSHGVCRLCRRQAVLARRFPLDVVAANSDGQQLFFAAMHKKTTVALGGRPPRTPPPRRRLPWPLRPVGHRQLVLFRMPYRLVPGSWSMPPTRDAVLADAINDHLDDYAQRHHWRRELTSLVRSGLGLLLGLQDTPGAAITTTEAAVLSQVRLPVRLVLEVLAEVAMHDDDRVPAVDAWFERQLVGLPEPMVSELRIWFDVMRNGSASSPRRRARSPTTIRLYAAHTFPAMRSWAGAGHDSLREVAAGDIVKVLPEQGTRRKLCGQGLRSIFGILKSRKVIFVNPAARLRTHGSDDLVLAWSELDNIRAALDSADPARAVVAALVAFHGLRTGQLAGLKLSDLRDGHLYIDGRVIPLAAPVRQRIATYLDLRAERWPHTENAHLFIHFRTAARLDPVGIRWLKLTLDVPGSVRALRQDRILDEAVATDGDTRRLCDLFGIGINAASRYTDAIGHPGRSGD